MQRAFYIGASESYELLMAATKNVKPKRAMKELAILKVDIKQGILNNVQ